MTTLLVLSLVLAAAPAEGAPSEAECRQAVEKSLPYLMKSSAAWRDERKCVTCHQLPFALWPLHEAKARGLTVDEKFTTDLTAWSLDFCLTNKNKPKDSDKEEFTGGFLSTMVKMVLALETAPQREDVAKAHEFFVPLIAKKQKEDGSWKEGNFIGLANNEREGIEVDTMWTILGLNALETQSGSALTPAARDTVTSIRERGLAWLKDAKPATRTDWLALRMVVELQCSDASLSDHWRQELLARQNKDGAWPFVKEGASNPLTTGECLYALSLMPLKGNEPEVARAQKYLVTSQEADGSWKAFSRQEFGKSGNIKFSDVATHWGTGWAAVGLLRTLPAR